MRISLLDRSRTRVGESDAEAVAGTIARAQRADALGFQRFWVAEHHAVPGIASAAPAVLLAAIGAHTERIRIGTGGIMVPNHRPLVIAEQALLLESLYPGRVDIGLGGSLGFTAPIRKALGRTVLGDGDYAAEIEQVRDFLHGSGTITAKPNVAPPPLFLLAIRDGLSLAARLGLPAVIGGPLLRDSSAAEAYVRDFRPSPSTPEPYLMVGIEVAVADTSQRARDLLLPDAWAYANSRDVGEFRALQPIEEVRRLIRDTAGTKKRDAIDSWTALAAAGTPEQVTDTLTTLVERTGAAEILATVSSHDRDDVAQTDTFLASLQD